MGLDMYIKSFDKEEYLKVEGTEAVFDIEQTEEIYWRKANAIHNYFVEAVQDGTDDCGYHNPITEYILEDLADRIKTILISNRTDLLPTASGFFFGSTEYDEGYFDDLKSTLEEIESLLERWDDDRIYMYRSSW